MTGLIIVIAIWLAYRILRSPAPEKSEKPESTSWLPVILAGLVGWLVGSWGKEE
ncbi:MAG: hypothetical protein HUU10_12855 [Bacteroidetes bacterium]|nr:hypothetical protein [Bacteroidota bacterium]